MKKIVHIAGMDSYEGHESGNYIVFKTFRKLPYESIHIFGCAKHWGDPDTFFVPLTSTASQVGLEDRFDAADVVIIYDTLLEPETLRKIYDKHKCDIVWVGMVHDFFTGGCSYPTECSRFQDSCGSCPQLIGDKFASHTGNENKPPSSDEKDQTYQLMQRKLNLLKDIPIYGVGVSNYSVDLMRTSSLLKDKHCECIPIPFDIPTSPLSRDEAKQQLNLPTDKFNILWGTTQPHMPRKGRKYVDESMNYLYNLMKEKNINTDTVLFTTVGPMPNPPFSETQPFNWKHIGYAPTREILSSVYKSANVGLQTTIEDAGPMMSVECLSNQTPLVSFDRCVSADIIENGKNGFLVDTYDSKSFGKSIFKVYESDVDMGINADFYVKRFNNEEQTMKKWQTLIERITSQ